jgi:phosphoribosylformylglycinamidine synthase
VRIDPESGLGVAVSTDCNGRFTKLDPYEGTRLALAEAFRNVAVTGARPMAVSDCLNFGSPEDPDVMWQFERATQGLFDGCKELGVPVTGGNVSFYNQTGDVAILPTPVVGVLGVMADVTRRVPSGFLAPDLQVFLLGETRDELDGSAWAQVEHGHLGGLPPRVDLAAEQALSDVLITGGRDGVLAGAHDVSDGGLAQTLAESCLRRDVGVEVTLEGDPFVGLFSESTARVVVAVRPERAEELRALCATHGVPLTRLGATTSEQVLRVDGVFDVPLAELRAAWSTTLAAAFAC